MPQLKQGMKTSLTLAPESRNPHRLLSRAHPVFVCTQKISASLKKLEKWSQNKLLDKTVYKNKKSS